jgi:hypothetical protein
MSVRFLTEEWADTVTAALNADDEFKREISKRQSTVAWHVDTPDGEVTYHLEMDQGQAAMRMGAPAGPADLNLSASYDDMVLIQKDELDGRKAFQSKRIRSDTRLIGVLKYLGVFHNLTRIVGGIDVDY